MNILVIGDGHIYGCGLAAGQLTYVGHFIRQLRQTTQSVTVEAYAHLTMSQLLSTLRHLPLNHYDLLIIQPDALSAVLPGGRQPQAGNLALPLRKNASARSTAEAGKAGKDQLIRGLQRAGRALQQAQRMNRSLSVLLKLLRPYRHNVLMLTPLPQREVIARWLGNRSRKLLLDEAGDQLFSVFDTAQTLLPHDEYFLDDTNSCLNAISHELLGTALFEFYQSAPTIVTVQAIRNETDSKSDVSDK